MKYSLVYFLLFFGFVVWSQDSSSPARTNWLNAVEKGKKAFEKGDYLGAIKLFEQTKEPYEAYYGSLKPGQRITKEDHQVEGNTQYMLGLSHAKIKDDIPMAQAILRRAITILKYHMGEDHPDTQRAVQALKEMEKESSSEWRINYLQARKKLQLGEWVEVKDLMDKASNGLWNYLRERYPRNQLNAGTRKIVLPPNVKNFPDYRSDMQAFANFSLFQVEVEIDDHLRGFGSGDNWEATTRINKARDVYMALGDSSGVALTSFYEGEVAFYRNKYDLAEKSFLKAIKSWTDMDSAAHPKSLRAHIELGHIYERRDEYQAAETILLAGKRKALHDKQRLADYTELVISLYFFYSDYGNYRSAELLLKECEAELVQFKAQNNIQYAYFLVLKGNFKMTEGSFMESLALLEQAKRMYDKFKLPRYSVPKASLYEYLTQSYFASAQYDSAKNYSFQLVFLNMMSFDPESRLRRSFADGKTSYGWAKFMSPTSFGLAITQLEACKKIVMEEFHGQHESYSDILNLLGLSYWHVDSLNRAYGAFLEELDVMGNRLQSKSSNLSLKDRELLLKASQRSFSNYESFCLAKISRQPNTAARVKGNWYNFRLKFKGFLATNEKIIKERVNASQNQLLINSYKAWRNINDSLVSVAKIPAFPASSKQRLEELSNSLERDMIKTLELTGSTMDASTVSWQDVQKRLKPDEAAIELARVIRVSDKPPEKLSAIDKALGKGKLKVTEVVYVALIIKPNQKQAPEIVVLENGAELEKLARNFYKLVSGPITDDLLYNQFWEPIAKQISGYKKVYLSPDGVYSQISIGAMKNPKSGAFVMDELDVHLVGNTKEIPQAPPVKRPPIKRASLFGFPDYKYASNNKNERVKDESLLLSVLPAKKDSATSRFFDGGDIDPLPGSKVEVEKINGLMNERKILSTLNIGQKATEEAIKQVQDVQVLHIATHGYFLSDQKQKGIDLKSMGGIQSRELFENPLLRSGLLLAGAQLAFETHPEINRAEDGILTAQEVLSLNLSQVDLIVLSACETGLGVVVNGEGVYGLQRSFQMAGAKSILMSLWNVDDEATQELMTNFYKQWLNGQSPSESLRQAQIALRKKYPDPYYWGAFVLVGD